MRYCKKCGAEIPEGAGFCEKCGSSIQGNTKRKGIIIGSCVGVIALVAVVVGVLFAMGVFGEKADVVQTNTDAAVSQGGISVTGEAVGGTEGETPSEQESPVPDAGDARDKAWEAYVAYKAFLKGREKEYEENHQEDEISYEESYGNNQYSLIHLDSDEYPELIVFDSLSTVENHFLYTYKNGEVIDTGFVATDVYYKEREGYIFDYSRHTIGTTSDNVYVLKGTYMENVYGNNYESEWDKSQKNSDYKIEEHFDSPDKVAEKCGIIGGWDEPVYGENIDEAYTQFLSLETK